MATTFAEQLDEDRNGAFLSLSQFAETVTYRVASSGTETQIPCAFEELSGGLENFVGETPRARAGIARISDDAANGIATPVQGDLITRDGAVWTVVKVNSDGLGMHELRCFLPETVA